MKLSKKDILTPSFLNECFEYKDGILIWKKRPLYHFENIKGMDWFNNRFIGLKSGSEISAPRSNTKYISVGISGHRLKLHRLIYIMFNGYIDDNIQIDHIDNNGLNNKLENLRAVTSSINQRNKPLQISNKTGINGVNWHINAKKWQARITDLNGKRIDLGRYDNFEDAVSVRKENELKYGYLQ